MSINHSVLSSKMSGRLGVLPRTLGLVLMGIVAGACSRTAQGPAAESKPQSGGPRRITVIAIDSVAGVIDPCGCVKDQLGGLDRFATAVQEISRNNQALLLETGALFFPRADMEPSEQSELTFRAEVLAKVWRSFNGFAWVPGRADAAFGAATLSRLAAEAGLRALPDIARLQPPTSSPSINQECEVKILDSTRVGICGLTTMAGGLSTPATVAGLKAAAHELTQRGASLKIALLDVQRGSALRAVEAVPDFQLIVLGSGHDDTLGADSDGSEPQRSGSTLVVQPPNHLRGFVRVDFTIRNGQFAFQDSTGVGRDIERQQVAQRISELTERIREWKKQKQDAALLRARETDLTQLEKRLAELSRPVAIATSSYFTVRTIQVDSQFAGEPSVRRALDELGRRNNEHNRTKFAARKAPPAAPGQATYVGVGMCETCHKKPAELWRNTRHAQAYQSLVKAEREFTLECVGCHVTGYEQPGGSSVTDVAGLKNVQCETCHGPGSTHAKSSARKDITRKPAREFCAERCHHTPNVAPNWSVDEALPHIMGPGHGQK